MSVHVAPWWSWCLQAGGFALAYSGAELNSRMNIKGFYFWLAANLVLCLLHLISGLILLCVLDLLYIRLNLQAIRRWKGARDGGPAADRASA